MNEQPPLPGGVGFSRLRVYPWETADGLHGGSPHMHVTCTECYLVLGGTGELHTLTTDGLRKTPLRAGDAVWFTPGTIHRAVNHGDLQVHVIMQNDGLPEAGDAVMTFPAEHLASPGVYAAAAALGDGPRPEREERAKRRRDLAIEGFNELIAGGEQALQAFYDAAMSLVAGKLDDWERLWLETAHAAAQRTGEQISALRSGDAGHLRHAKVSRLDTPPDKELGMCGFLAPYRRS